MTKALLWGVSVSVASGVVLATALFFADTSESPGYSITSETPQVRTIEQTVTASGFMRPQHVVTSFSQISGVVEEVFVQPGDRVETHELLVRIRNVPDPEHVSEARKQVELASITLSQAQMSEQRLKKLASTGATSRAALEQATHTRLQEEAELAAAQSVLELTLNGAPVDDEQSTNFVRATLSGYVMSIGVERGSFVRGSNNLDNGTKLAAIADLATLQFEGNIDEGSVPFLEVGMDVTILTNPLPDIELPGRIEFIAPEGLRESAGVTFGIRASIRDEDIELVRPGYSANAKIVLRRSVEVLALEERFLEFRPDRILVRTLDEENNVQHRAVTLGVSDGIWAEVVSGVEPDTRLVLPMH